jgi:hypothetical protein
MRNTLSCLAGFATLALTAALGAAAAHAQDPPPQEGVEVLARGPVHEAYAEPVGAPPRPGPVVPKAPPDAIEEAPPDQKPAGDNVQWLPGYWQWDEERKDYLWISGFWRVPPPERRWVPGHWSQAEAGWQWTPGFWGAPEQKQVTYLPPPPDPIDAGPSVPAPGPDHVYVAGTWVYYETRYVWRPGYWCACRPGWVWVPAHFVWTPCGYVFVDGYWDYTLRERGLLFAPVYIDVAVYRRPRWVYQPCFVVSDECLVGALFVRPGYCHYYFGDYYDPVYSRAGFTAWFDVRIGRQPCDPLFCYYRWHYRDDVRWEAGVRQLYVARVNGAAPRPPRTLVQQNTVVQNITINNVNNTTVNNTVINKNITNNTTNVKNVAMLSPLSKVDPAVAKLQPVAPQQRAAFQQSALQTQAAGQQRSRLEAQVRAQGPPPVRPTDAPRVAKLDLPPTPAVKSPAAVKAPPPPPVRPLANVAPPSPAHPVSGGPSPTQPGGSPPGVKPLAAPVPGSHPDVKPGGLAPIPPPGPHPAAGPMPPPPGAKPAPILGRPGLKPVHPPAKQEKKNDQK